MTRLALGTVAALLLAACGAPAPAPTPAPATEPVVRPLVLLLHGRGLLGRDSAALRRTWTTSLRSGVVGLTGAPVLGDSDVRVVWYADVLDSESDASCRFAPGDPRANRVMGGDETLQILTSGIGTVLGALGGLVENDVATLLRDVAGDLQYLGDAGKRCAAERRLSRALARARNERRPVVLVAHSFGSLVAYDVLTAEDSANAADIERLVTIGAMVGSPILRHLLFGVDASDALSLPPGVRSWVNVRNPADPLAIPLSPVASGATTILDEATSQGDIDPEAHEIVSYLRDTVTASAVLGAWCAAFKPVSKRPVACGRVEGRAR